MILKVVLICVLCQSSQYSLKCSIFLGKALSAFISLIHRKHGHICQIGHQWWFPVNEEITDRKPCPWLTAFEDQKLNLRCIHRAIVFIPLFFFVRNAGCLNTRASCMYLYVHIWTRAHGLVAHRWVRRTFRETQRKRKRECWRKQIDFDLHTCANASTQY